MNLPFSYMHMTERDRLEQRAVRARGLARQATEERQRLERMLETAKRKECIACAEALTAEGVALAAKPAEPL